jgi:hypothetical protein
MLNLIDETTAPTAAISLLKLCNVEVLLYVCDTI